MKKVHCGNEMDRMPDWAFKGMAFLFNIADKFKSPDKKLDSFNIMKGQSVIDYGSGTGRYLIQASKLVGDKGKVYAVDIHDLAIESVFKMIKRHDLKNVIPLQTDGKSVNIPSFAADIIYALDMFHMVSDPQGFLKELCRITRPDGILYLEDGHQPRALAKKKVEKSGCWQIIEEHKRFMKCRPIHAIA